MKMKISTLCFLILTYNSAAAGNYYVNASSGSNSTGDGTSAKPWKTITHALGQISGTGHTIHISNGTYDATLGEMFPILLKNGISLKGEGDGVVIEANGTTGVFRGIGLSFSIARMEGLVLRNGKSTDGGSAIFLSAGSKLSINQCVIQNMSHASNYGSTIKISNYSNVEIDSCVLETGELNGYASKIIDVDFSTFTISGSIIRDYSYESGQDHVCLACDNGIILMVKNIFMNLNVRDVLYLLDSDVDITNNQILKNQGRGIFVSNTSGKIANNTLSDNNGDGIILWYQSLVNPEIINNIIAYQSGYGISEYHNQSDPAKVYYNLFYYNTKGLYHDEGSTDYFTASSLNSSVAETKYNLDVDPIFKNRSANDYSLMANSPAIDSGDPEVIKDQDGTRADMGAIFYDQFDYPPDPPENLYAISGPEQVTLTWSMNQEPDFLRYRIYGGISPNPVVCSDSINLIADTTIVISQLSEGVIYYFRITAVDHALQESTFSNEVCVSPMNTVAGPIFNPLPGTYQTAQYVVVYCSTPGSKIYYTLDGSDPTESSLLYRNPIPIINTMTIKARAFNAGWNSSEIASGIYVITGTVTTPTFNPAPGLYTSPQLINISCSVSDAIIHYTINGSDPTTSDPTFSTPVPVSADLMLKARAFKTDWNPSLVATGEYRLTGKVATPSFEPAPGTFSTTQSISIKCTTPGATIYYTINGDDPSASDSVFSSKISLDSTAVLKAKAYKAEWDPSDVALGSYIIARNTVTTPSFDPPPGTFAASPQVIISCSTPEAVIFYTTDGEDPTDSDPVYIGPVLLDTTTVLKARAYRTEWVPSSIASGFYLIENLLDTVEAPVFDPPPGSYEGPVRIGIFCKTDGAGIHYTLDGSDPDEEDAAYGDSITISGTLTLKARAFKEGMEPGPVTAGLYEIVGSTAAPVFDPPPGDYDSAQDVSISCLTEGAEIYYTLNGLDPVQTDSLYSNPVHIDTVRTLKARAYKTGNAPSAVTAGLYRVIIPSVMDTVEASVFNPAPGEYAEAQTVTITCPTEGAFIHFTRDGTDPDESDSLYQSPLAVDATDTLKARAFKTGYEPSPVVTGIYTIHVQDMDVVAVPMFNPEPGAFNKPVPVTISCMTGGAIIHYTLNGADPLESDLVYNNPVQISATSTLKARAFISGKDPSPVASGSYVIQIVDIDIPQTPSVVMTQSPVISASVSNVVGSARVLLHYRKGGSSRFDTTAMQRKSGDAFEAFIPSFMATERGLEYAILVLAGGDTLAISDTLQCQVSFTALPCPNATPSTSYRMISVPADLDASPVSGVLEDDLGKSDRSSWRLVRKKAGGFEEYGMDAAFEGFEPGNAFWLITRTSGTWDVGSGKSTSTAGPYAVTLHPGWNQIGNPFAFDVAWSSVIRYGDVEAPVGYEGSGNEVADYKYQQLQVEPWKGYYVKNLESQDVTIEILPVEAGEDLGKRNFRLFTCNPDLGEWILRIHAESRKGVDRDNWIGVLQDAADQWDSKDFSEVPRFEKSLSVSFPHDDWEKYPGEYTGDFRSPGQGPWTWMMRASSNLGEEIRLSLAELRGVPENLEIELQDEFTGAVMDFRKREEYRFAMKSAEDRLFRLTMGRGLEIEEVEGRIIPDQFVLYQNYPNPFNPETHIAFDIPDQAQVKAVVYDRTGKKIFTLADRPFEYGRHELIWPGIDESGLPVSSGLYLIHLQAGGFRAIRKMVFMK
ncbi:chitobiase/beta-hexosaminidase C-terminal domain-containing protein [bacterium]|nr:chitobiase/beta-hexosaminidase C-terminal domain-containing protein [bacterium]